MIILPINQTQQRAKEEFDPVKIEIGGGTLSLLCLFLTVCFVASKLAKIAQDEK